jgi:murein DD-endopeptidase MepM/ murein hydrolase activator NlpD
MSLHAWPVPKWLSKYNYHHAPRSFGANRDHGKRQHAGCDLYAPEGSPVVSIANGVVMDVYEFYGKADAVEINHGALGIIRYGELIASDDIDKGSLVKPGTPIGKIARLVGIHVHPMLHFEMYTGKGSGKLTVRGNSYHRRSDLIDPTAFLDRLHLMSHKPRSAHAHARN